GSIPSSTPAAGRVGRRREPRLLTGECLPQRIGGMEIADLITPRSVLAQLRVSTKKQALQELAKRAAAMIGIHERTIYDVLIERERLGTTGIGMGIGIPHAKLPGLTRL